MKAEDFRHRREEDMRRLGRREAEWMARWEWAEQYQTYSGSENLIRWFEWLAPYPHYLPPEQVEPLAQLSEMKHREILNALDASRDYVYQHVDEYNATDYLFQTCYPVPQRMQVKRMLDFGAAFGRQINLWSQLQPELAYVGMDAIENAYCLQHFYYSHFNLPLREYVLAPGEFAVEASPGIYHLPTWRADLLPDDFFDVILCVQVFPEVSEQLVRYLLNVFQRCLKPGGALYLRDHDLAARYAHDLDLNKVLPEKGFMLEFRPYVADTYHSLYHDDGLTPDIHGVPRIWRKLDPCYPPNGPLVSEAEQHIWGRARQRVASLDRRCGGLGRKLYRTLKKRQS